MEHKTDVVFRDTKQQFAAPTKPSQSARQNKTKSTFETRPILPITGPPPYSEKMTGM
jgi:hypothetical protein